METVDRHTLAPIIFYVPVNDVMIMMMAAVCWEQQRAPKKFQFSPKNEMEYSSSLARGVDAIETHFAICYPINSERTETMKQTHQFQMINTNDTLKSQNHWDKTRKNGVK